MIDPRIQRPDVALQRLPGVTGRLDVRLQFVDLGGDVGQRPEAGRLEECLRDGLDAFKPRLRRVEVVPGIVGGRLGAAAFVREAFEVAVVVMGRADVAAVQRPLAVGQRVQILGAGARPPDSLAGVGQRLRRPAVVFEGVL